MTQACEFKRDVTADESATTQNQVVSVACMVLTHEHARRG